MDVVVSRCAGIEIGKSEVVVCLRIPGSDGERLSEVRTFSLDPWTSGLRVGL